MNRHALMIFLCLFAVIPLALTLPIWAAVLQASVAGASIGAHAIMWYDEHDRKKRNLALVQRNS